MKIKIKTLANLWEAVGRRREILLELEEKSKVMDIVRKLIEMFGDPVKKILLDDKGKLNSMVSVMVNGRELNYEEMHQVELKDGDEVLFMPPVVGG